MPWNAPDTHVPAFITLVDCIRYTFVLRVCRPMSAHIRYTYAYTRMRIRNDTQSKRDSRVNEKVNTGAYSRRVTYGHARLRQSAIHSATARRGNVELVLRDGIFRIVNRSGNRRKSQHIDVANVEIKRD